MSFATARKQGTMSFSKLYKCLWGIKARSRGLPEAPLRSVLEVRVDLKISVILQHVPGKPGSENTTWSKSTICQHLSAQTGLPAAVRELPWPLNTCPWRGQAGRISLEGQLQYHIISSAIQWSHLIQEHVNINQSLLKLGKEQNKPIVILLCHQDINPQAARQIPELLQWWWKGRRICGHSGSTRCDFPGIQAHFFSWFTPVGSIMMLSSIVDNNVQRHTKIWYRRKIQMKESEPFLRGWFLRLYSCRTKVSRCHT